MKNQMLESFLDGLVKIFAADITAQNTDAIVNAANSTLLGGGGVDGAIHSRGGDQILAECREIRRTMYPKGLPTGQAVLTSAGNLPAKFVIHTVGPIYELNSGDDAELLASCYQNCLKIATENDVKSISFPSISTGAFAYPKHEAAAVSSTAIKNFVSENSKLSEIRLVFFNLSDAQKFLKHHKF